tara:strand:+ start:70 stop:531 length:462 start_codon:yes stop_codon:yes gene_type:complete
MINKISLLLFLFLPQLLFSQIFKEKYITEANEFCTNWLSNLNNKNYSEAYNGFHEKVKLNSDSLSSCNAFAQLMEEFGALKSRKIDTTFFQSNIEELGDGFYVFIKYSSYYKKIDLCEEYIIVGQNDQLKWKILRYDFSHKNNELNNDKESSN